jgi:outer membrane protein
LISALKNHPSIISSHLKTQSVIYSIKASRGSMLPQLSLTGNLYTNYSNASQLNQVSYINTSQNIGYLQSNHNEIVVRDAIQPIDNYSKYSFKNQLKDNISNSVSLSLFVPIFNNENRHTIEKLKISLENSKLNEQVVKNNFRNNFEQINRDVENAIAKYNTTKEQLEVLQMLFKNTNLKYNAGLISITDLLIEKNKYAQAESDNIQARFELILRIKILEYLQLEKQ